MLLFANENHTGTSAEVLALVIDDCKFSDTCLQRYKFYLKIDCFNKKRKKNIERAKKRAKKVNTYHNHAEVPMYKGFEAG